MDLIQSTYGGNPTISDEKLDCFWDDLTSVFHLQDDRIAEKVPLKRNRGDLETKKRIVKRCHDYCSNDRDNSGDETDDDSSVLTETDCSKKSIRNFVEYHNQTMNGSVVLK
jgi:hypothetical protein